MQIDFSFFEKPVGRGFTPQRGLVISTSSGAGTEVEGHHIEIPLFQIAHRDIAGVFSFFPGRPSGDLQLHASDDQLIEEFKRQFVASYNEKNLDWFYSKLTPDTYKKLIELTRVTTPPPNLSPFAQLLYDAFQSLGARKPIEEVSFKGFSAGTVLEDELYQFYSMHYASRLKLLAVERGVQDWEDVKNALSTFFNETVGLLLTPVPGSIKGLNRLLRYLVVGVTAQGLVSGLEHASKGDSVELLQVLTDILDILINAPLYTTLGKSARKWHLKVLNDLGNPRKLTLANGQSQLWYPDPGRYVRAPSGVFEGMTANEQGIYSHEGRYYISLEKDNRLYSVEVELQGTEEQYVLVHADPSVYRPPVAYDSRTQHWKLALDDSASLTDDQLLRRMVPDLWASEAQVMLNVSAVNRATLDAVWAGGDAPAALNDAISRFHADRLIVRIARDLSLGQPAMVPLERPVLALMTQMVEWPDDMCLRVLDYSGNVTEEYGKQLLSSGFSRSIELKRLLDGQLVLNTATAFKAFPGDTFSQIIKLLPGAPLDPVQVSQAMALKFKNDKERIFESLTFYKNYTRVDHARITAFDTAYYPVALKVLDRHLAVVKRLRETSPDLSQIRAKALVVENPLLEQVYPRAVSSEPERKHLIYIVERAEFLSRSDKVVDSIYYARLFNADADQWMCAVCVDVIKQKFGLTLIIYSAVENLDDPQVYISDDHVVLRGYGSGEYAAYEPRERLTMTRETGPDGFFVALMTGLFIVKRAKGWLRVPLQDVAQWRKVLGDELVKHRNSEGYFSLPLQTYEDYADHEIKWSVAMRPLRSGYFISGTKLYVVIDGLAYQVQQEFYGYRVKVLHPTMFARTPLVAYGNGMGAWRHADENPLAWEGQKLFIRLGYTAAGFNPENIDAILKVSGTTEGVLRRVHTNVEATPGLLADTLQRFTNYRRLETLLAHLKSDSNELFMSRIIKEFHDFEQAGLMAWMTDEQKIQLQGLFETAIPRAPWVNFDEQARSYIQLVYHQLKTSTGKVTPPLFKLIDSVTEYSQDPSVALILRVFPSLATTVAEDMIRHANDVEIKQMVVSGRVPLRLAEEARWYVRELRLNRAFEGFYWPALQNNDSVVLMMHAFGEQPEWPADCYFEVRDGSTTGRIISQSGPVDASVRVSIIKTVTGWQARNSTSDTLIVTGTDLFGVVLAALPAPQREVLGYLFTGGEELFKEHMTMKVTQQRELASQVLGMSPNRPWFNQPKRLAYGRLGYELSGRGDTSGLTHETSWYDRYKVLYPAKARAQVVHEVDAIGARGLDIALEISQLEADFAKLEEQLGTWVAHQHEFVPGDFRARDNKRRIADRLIKAWRKETPPVVDQDARVQGYRLDLDNLQISNLPVLDVKFPHVRSLSMTRTGLLMATSENVNQFLRNFSALTSLNMEHSGLTFFATAIEHMPHLAALSLANNIFMLNASHLSILARLTQLQDLNLSGCRLLGVLDVRRLTELRALNLSRTDALGWPMGVTGLSHLTSLDLTHNEILDVPPDVFQSREYELINRVTHLSGNNLSAESLQHLSNYQRRTGINFGLHLGVEHPASAQYDSHVWLTGLSAQDRMLLQMQWDALVDEPGSDQFFELLDRLKTTADYLKAKDDLVRRVRSTLEAAAQDEVLRSALFHLAANRVSCCDSAAFIFSALETEVLVFEARATPDPLNVELNLAKLRRGQFRLLEVDRLATRDAQQRREQSQAVDEVELILSYRLALTETLQLPGQPKNIKYGALAKVETSVIEAARLDILKKNNSDEMLSFMTKESFWVEFLEARYVDRFTANTEHKAEIDFEALQVAGSTSYEVSNTNFDNWKRERQALLTSLTRDALAKLDALQQAAAPE